MQKFKTTRLAGLFDSNNSYNSMRSKKKTCKGDSALEVVTPGGILKNPFQRT